VTATTGNTVFDLEQRHLAARIIERAKEAKDGNHLIAALREEFPNKSLRAIARGAFIAVTRPSVSQEALPTIYDLAIYARRSEFDETVDL
jgi:hypothetical protein